MTRALMTALVALPLTLVGTSAAHAADLNPSVPSKVVVNQSYENLSVTLTGPYSRDYTDAWVELENYKTRDYVDSDYLTGQTRTTLRVDSMITPGKHRVFIDLAYADIWDEYFEDYMPEEISGGSDYTTIKYGSRASLSSSRSGRYVTLSARSTRYDTWGDWVSNRSATASFQLKTSSGWSTKKKVTLNSTGRASARIYRPSKGTWRVVVSATSKAWGSTSAATSR